MQHGKPGKIPGGGIETLPPTRSGERRYCEDVRTGAHLRNAIIAASNKSTPFGIGKSLLSQLPTTLGPLPRQEVDDDEYEED